jgi:transcriptional regulator with XRE-family HTH domain
MTKRSKPLKCFLEQLGARIHKIRAKRDVSIHEIAAKGLSAGNWCEIEQGKRDPRLSTLCEISARLKIPLEDLLEGLC